MSEIGPPAPEWPYVWAWARRPMDRDRKGMRCRVLVRGAKNSALVEFEDGVQHVTSRNGLRKAIIAPGTP